MMVSHEKNFLFIHVQRTGGGTVSKVLKGYRDHPKPKSIERFLRRIPVKRDPGKMWYPTHATAEYVRRRWPVSAFDSYFKFAFVRNPWSWLLSLYSRMASSSSHRHHSVISKMTFPEYVDWEIRRDKRHQYKFVCDRNGRLIIDFVGRLEYLHRDVCFVCDRIGVAPPAEQDLPRVGSRKHAPWWEVHNEYTLSAVRRHWWRDFELFDYETDPDKIASSVA